MSIEFDPTIWGPHYWFFLHTVAESYPLQPNAITKRKYYDLFINLPIFIPNPEISNKFSEYLDKYPVSPYLDNRESLIRWVHFIHNKVNRLLGKDEILLPDALEQYRNQYRPPIVYFAEKYHIRQHYIYAFFILFFIFLIYYFYDR